MSKSKKPTQRETLDEIKDLLKGLQKSVPQQPDNELAYLYQLLYAAVARFGLAIPGAPGGVVSTLQLRLLNAPSNHTLIQEPLDNGSILVQIIDTSFTEAPESEVETPRDDSRDTVSIPSEENREDGGAHGAVDQPKEGQASPSSAPVDPFTVEEDEEMRRQIEEMNK